MTNQAVRRRRWWITPLLMLVGGSAITIAAAAGGSKTGTVVGLLVITVVATVGWALIGRTRTDFGDLVASSPDERQRTLDLRAQAVAGFVLVLVLLVGTVVNLAQGHNGNPWATLCAVYGLSYLIALFVFRNR